MATVNQAISQPRREAPPIGRLRAAAQRHLSALVVAPSFTALLVFVYGFILWTVYISFTRSRILPVYTLAGTDAYERLWQMERWGVAITNLFLFGGLFIGISLLVG